MKLTLRRKSEGRSRWGIPAIAAAFIASLVLVSPADAATTTPASAPARAAAVADTVSFGTVADLSQQAVVSRLATTAQSVMYAGTASLLSSYTGLCEGGIRKGPGLKLGNDQVVLYMCLYKGHDYALLCPDPLKPASNPVSVAAATSIGGATNFNAAAYIAWNYARFSDGGASKRYDNNWATATRLAYWTYAGLAARVKADLVYANSTVKSLYTTMTTNAYRYAGPYKVTYVSQSVPVLTGAGWTVGWRKYRVTSSRGYGMPGLPFSLKVTSGAAQLSATAVKTDVNGYLTIAYKPTTWGNVGISAMSAPVAANAVLNWKPIYSTYQRFNSGLSVQLKTSFAVSVAPKAVLAYTCTTACFGEAPVKTSAPVCNTYGTSVRLELFDNGALRPEVYTPASGACVTPVWKVKDTHTAQMRLGVLVNGTWVYYIFAKIVVDCPPWPTVQFSGGFNCLSGKLTVVAPANAAHAVRVTVNGVSQVAGKGASASKSVTFTCNVAHTYSVQTGIQRYNGAWNVSPVATIAFPAVVS